MDKNEFRLDIRLQEKFLQSGKLKQTELNTHLKGLKDLESETIGFDDEGVPVDAPTLELKELMIKPGPPEPQNPEPPKPEIPLLEDLGLE